MAPIVHVKDLPAKHSCVMSKRYKVPLILESEDSFISSLHLLSRSATINEVDGDQSFSMNLNPIETLDQLVCPKQLEIHQIFRHLFFTQTHTPPLYIHNQVENAKIWEHFFGTFSAESKIIGPQQSERSSS